MTAPWMASWPASIFSGKNCRPVLPRTSRRRWLQQALDYAQTLLRSSPDGVIAVDHDLRITEWNLRMEQMCGKSRAQVIGLVLAEIPFMQETGEAARIRKALKGKASAPGSSRTESPERDREILRVHHGAIAGARRGNPWRRVTHSRHHRAQAGAADAGGIRKSVQDTFSTPCRTESSWRMPKPSSSEWPMPR